MVIHNRLQQARKHLGKSQLDFAKELGVSSTSYKNYEKNENPVPSALLVRLCELYPISPSWVLLGKGNMLSEPPTKLVRSAILAANAVIAEFDFHPSAEQEEQLICKMFEQLYKENYEETKLRDAG